MTSDTSGFDPSRVAHALVGENSYLTIATASSDGAPWATPVWFAARGLEVFVWASKPGAQHSRNIAENPLVALVLFDGRATPGEGTALYVRARAELADRETFEQALDIYNARSRDAGLPVWDAAQLVEPARHRLYRAVVIESFVLDDHDERVRVEY